MTNIRVNAIVLSVADAPRQMAAGIATDLKNFKPTWLDSDLIGARARKSGAGELARSMLLMPTSAVRPDRDFTQGAANQSSAMDPEVFVLTTQSLPEIERMVADAKRPTVALGELVGADAPVVALHQVEVSLPPVRIAEKAANAAYLRPRTNSVGKGF